MKSRSNFKDVLFGALWISLIIIISVGCVVMQIFDDYVKSVLGDSVWNAIYIVMPLIVLVIPFIIRYKLKDNWKKVLWCSFILFAAYFVIVFFTPLATYSYLKDFTPEKWVEYKSERKIMLEDLKDKYKLIGMTEKEAENILGVPDVELDNESEYVINRGWVDPEMFVLKFKEGKVVQIYTYTEFKPNQ